MPEADRIAGTRKQIAKRLARPRRPFNGAVWDAELRKHLQRIADRLESLEKGEPGRKAAAELCIFDVDRLDLGAALAVSTKLDELVAELGDEATVCSMLENEFQREETSVDTWKKLYDDKLPAALALFRAGSDMTPNALRAARNGLQALFHTRHENYELMRARQAMKGAYLLRLVPALLVLDVALAWLIVRLATYGWKVVLITGLAGALGAVLAGTLKLRDAISHINDLRAFRPVIVVQPLVGAAFAFVLLIALQAGVVDVGSGNGWARRALLGFVAGFSEPFSLKLVEGVAKLAEPRGAHAKSR